MWEQLKEHHESQTPVKGRVLNAVNGGYAVGFSGLVAFCPFTRYSRTRMACSPDASPVGFKTFWDRVTSYDHMWNDGQIGVPAGVLTLMNARLG